MTRAEGERIAALLRQMRDDAAETLAQAVAIQAAWDAAMWQSFADGACSIA